MVQVTLDLDHQPAQFERVPQFGGQAGQRREHPLERRRHRRAGRRRLREPGRPSTASTASSSASRWRRAPICSTVINGVKAVFPDIKAQLPQGLRGEIVYDATNFVNSSIHEVVMTLIEALVIVMAGDLRVPGIAAFGPDSDRCHSAVAHRHAGDHAGARIFDQSTDAAGAGAGHRSGGRRRHHRGREREPASRGRHGRRWPRRSRRARTRRPDHRHDGGAAGGVTCRSDFRAA